MTDRELLELAAKAAGVELEWDGPPDIWQPMYYQGKTYHGWNPLTDDSDALRLAVRLKLRIACNAQCARVRIPHSGMDGEMVPHEADPYAATRRAIVRAAAEIGKDMK